MIHLLGSLKSINLRLETLKLNFLQIEICKKKGSKEGTKIELIYY